MGAVAVVGVDLLGDTYIPLGLLLTAFIEHLQSANNDLYDFTFVISFVYPSFPPKSLGLGDICISSMEIRKYLCQREFFFLSENPWPPALEYLGVPVKNQVPGPYPVLINQNLCGSHLGIHMLTAS